MKKLIKKRKAKPSKRGLYIQDKELKLTNFNIGSNFKYIVDINNSKLIVVPTDEKVKNRVSRRITKEGLLKPVIDIRTKEVLSSFRDMDYLQVSIYYNQIIVEGFINDNDCSSITEKNKIGNVTDITNIIKVKKKTSCVIPKVVLSKAVGDISTYDRVFEQLSLDIDRDNITTLKSNFNTLKIPLKVVSLFSGAGVMDKAFTDNGFDIVFAIDKDKGACQTYRYNIGNIIVNEDITKLNKDKLPKASMIIGGPPCQGFSKDNRRTNYLNNPKNLLVREFINTVKANENCSIFVLENVPQLLTAGDGLFIRQIEKELDKFKISKGVLCSADYGTAQIRDRAIIVGSKIGKIELPKPTVNIYKTVREAFKGLHDKIPNQMDYTKPKQATIDCMKCVPPGGNIENVSPGLRPKGGHSCSYKRLEWDKPSSTILNVRKNNITHPELNRSLSIRESARLFGLKDNFIFKGTLGSMQQQIANAVAYDLSCVLANLIKKHILKFNVQTCIN